MEEKHMMKSVKIRWKQTNLQELNQEEDTYFYAFSRGLALLYMGLAYNQKVSDEVRNALRAFDIKTSGLAIWLGYTVESDFGRITKQIIKDVECLLICTHEPTYNTQCKASYSGRNNLKVRNRRWHLLRSCVKVEGWRIYYTCR